MKTIRIYTLGLILTLATSVFGKEQNLSIIPNDLIGQWEAVAIEKNNQPALKDVSINFDFVMKENIIVAYIKPTSPTMPLPTIPGVVTLDNKKHLFKITPKTDELPPILEPALQAMGAPFLTRETTFTITVYKANKELKIETTMEDLNSKEILVSILLKKKNEVIV